MMEWIESGQDRVLKGDPPGSAILNLFIPGNAAETFVRARRDGRWSMTTYVLRCALTRFTDDESFG